MEAFTKGIEIASETFLRNPMNIPHIPAWDRVTSAIPEFLDRLRKVVEEDNRS